jgi:hypothetical protein
MLQHAEGHLLEFVGARCRSGRLTGRMHCWQKQSNEDANDGDHHEQFDQREALADGRSCGA